MIKSMTGFGLRNVTNGDNTYNIEIKSVNIIGFKVQRHSA